MFKFLKKNKGFSLVEFLIVILIIAIFSAIAFPNYRSTQQQLTLQRSASKLAQDIRRAQEMAVSAKECPTEICGGSVPIMPPGYGIYLEQGRTDYLIYADTSPQDGNERYDVGSDKIVERIEMEKGIKIENLSVPPMSINFKPPDPKVNIFGGEEEAAITLSVGNGSYMKTIKVNKAGLIYVE